MVHSAYDTVLREPSEEEITYPQYFRKQYACQMMNNKVQKISGTCHHKFLGIQCLQHCSQIQNVALSYTS